MGHSVDQQIRWYAVAVAAVYQRQLSMPSHRDRLMSTSESWGVNAHTTRCTSPVGIQTLYIPYSYWGWTIYIP